MLRRIPYSSNLISVGNTYHPENSPVWSDGKIAYGWNYTGGTNVFKGDGISGFWVGVEGYSAIHYPDTVYNYRVAYPSGFGLSKFITVENGHGTLQNYPAYADLYEGDLPESGTVYYLDDNQICQEEKVQV